MLLSADDYFPLTSTKSSTPSIGVDPMRSLRKWRAVASNPAVK